MAYFPFIHQTGQPASPGQHCQQGQLRQRYSRRTIIDQHDIICRQSEFITTTGSRTVNRTDIFLLGIFGSVFDAIAGLIGEFTEVHLVIVGRHAKHADISTGTEHLRMIGTQNDATNLRVFKAQTLDRVIQLDINTEIIRIEFQLVARLQRGIFTNRHCKTGDIAVNRQIPVLVLIWAGGKIYPWLTTGPG